MGSEKGEVCSGHAREKKSERGVKEENELKWFVILVDCGACGKAYEEIMEVRVINEPIEHAESE